MLANTVGKEVLDILFPPSCPYCQKLLKDGEEKVCRKCEASLPFLPMSEQLIHMDDGGLCLSTALYEDTLREAFLRYKFRGRYFYAEIFAPHMANALRNYEKANYDFISWVPVSPSTLRKRGYDQAFLLAKEMGKLLGESELLLPCLATNKRKKQSSIIDPSKREANVAGKFSVLDHSVVMGKSILLVDDVYTTGSTFRECRKVLLDGGAKAVIGMSFCRSPSTDRKRLLFESYES